MEVAIEAGADDDGTDEEGGIEVVCAPGDFAALKQALAQAGLEADVAEITMKP
jgi:transcriptional/translational regulatory protein YebC/TACO1